jgi:predicted amidohydrolase YtcJ
MMKTFRITDAEVDGRIVDVRWRNGVVLSVRSTSDRSLGMDQADVLVDADGGALLPGLHDHHLHLMALAAARASVHVGPPEVLSEAAFALALRSAGRKSMDGWVRAVGYHESVAGDIDAAALDRLVPEGADVAVRVQHRSGQLWILNERAIVAADLGSIEDSGVERDPHGRPTGRVYGLDRLLAQRIPTPPPDLVGAATEIASYGVTGITDLTPTEDAAELDLLLAHVGHLGFPLDVTITGGLGLPTDDLTGLGIGPVKFLPDHRVPDPDALAEGFRRAHKAGRNVAVHCVSRVGLVVALWAWNEVGARPGDRIEHGGVIPEELFDEIRALGLTVVTQPNFVSERGDAYLAEVDSDDIGSLWRCGSLQTHGIAVAAGTDAPFGHPDPWRAMAAAVNRTTPSGTVLGSSERISPKAALSLFLGGALSPAIPRQIVDGATTDLCLLDRSLDRSLADLSSKPVRQTFRRS